MANQNSLVALILSTSLLCAAGISNESTGVKRSLGTLGQGALDAIIVTIAEVSSATSFMGSISTLKSLENDKGKPGDKILQCVGGLIESMNNILGELRKMENFDFSWSTRLLEIMVENMLNFNAVCDLALRNADGTIRLMVLRKLQDIVMLTNDVIFRVDRLRLDGKVTWKP